MKSATTLNTYMSELDYSEAIQLIKKKGQLRNYRKGDFFIRQGEISRFVGWIETGAFQYVYTNETASDNVVGFSFAQEFVCDYSSFLKEKPSLVHIKALTACTVYELSYRDVMEYWKSSPEAERFGRLVAESLFEMSYKRLLRFYCKPEIRYAKLMERCPNLKEKISLKSIASFLGVTPETVSHIRKKLLQNEKS